MIDPGSESYEAYEAGERAKGAAGQGGTASSKRTAYRRRRSGAMRRALLGAKEEASVFYVPYTMTYAFLYSRAMKIAHRYNWHHVTVCHPDGDTVLWCKWCGLRSVEIMPVNLIDMNRLWIGPAEVPVVDE